MKVYVITQGSYSDYHICGVVIDRKVAEQMVDRLNRMSSWYSDANIEEYDTDEQESILSGNLTIYGVRLSSKGKVIRVCKHDEFPLTYRQKFNSVEKCWNEFDIVVVAKDEDHAKKIAQDIFAEYKYREEVEVE